MAPWGPSGLAPDYLHILPPVSLSLTHLLYHIILVALSPYLASQDHKTLPFSPLVS